MVSLIWTAKICKIVTYRTNITVAIKLLLLLLLTGQYIKCRTHGRDQSQGHLTEVRTKSVNRTIVRISVSLTFFWTTQHFQPPWQCPEVGSIRSVRLQRRNVHRASLSWLVEERRAADALMIAGTVLICLRGSNWKCRQGQAHAVPCKPADNV